jgi:hypothetical protein
VVTSLDTGTLNCTVRKSSVVRRENRRVALVSGGTDASVGILTFSFLPSATICVDLPAGPNKYLERAGRDLNDTIVISTPPRELFLRAARPHKSWNLKRVRTQRRALSQHLQTNFTDGPTCASAEQPLHQKNQMADPRFGCPLECGF